MNTRLQQFINAENLTQSQFADSINVARASISHILSGRNKPGYDFLLNLSTKYPDLNIDWLISGRGKMYDNSNSNNSANSKAGFNYGTNGNDIRQEDEVIDMDNTEFGPLFGQDNSCDTESSAEKTEMKNENMPSGERVVSNIENSGEINTSTLAHQVTVNQRKAKKIIIFYDDGTFQEIQ